jgi:signal transduction histidine kinase
MLEDLGLSTALRQLIEEFAHRHNLQVDIDLLPDLNGLFRREAQINIYRIFQESLTNIGKYAKASSLTVVITSINGQVSFLLADNGQGFEVEKVLHRKSTSRGLGLAAIEERVRMLGGSLEILSKRGVGTKIAFKIPVT